MKGSLKVIIGGLFSTIQDNGRFGFRKFGVPVSGAMDKEAYKWANRLLGQSEKTPVIEMTQQGGEFQFNTDAIISITGADMSARLNGDLISINKVHKIKEGDRLEFDSPIKGCRTYMGILGDWNLEKVMDSYSTYILGKFGGLHGELLDVGDLISWEVRKPVNMIEEIPKEFIPYYSSKITLNIEKGPEWDWLDNHQKEQFLSAEFKMSSKSNRMGFRLNGEESIKIPKQEMRSSGVFPGVIQLPPNGQPIILMNDAQTVGGYPRIGVVPDRFMSSLAQIPINGTIRFKLR